MSVWTRIKFGFAGLFLLALGGADVYAKHIAGRSLTTGSYSADGPAAVAAGIGLILGGLGCLLLSLIGSSSVNR